MHLFNIANFKSASFPQVQEYLQQHNTLRYQIIIPKQEYDGNTDFTQWQYYMAAYAGHLLSIISTSFSYNVPCLYRIDPFLFQIEYTDPKKLLVVLHHIITGYYTKAREAAIFQTEAFQHYNNCFIRQTESACWGLLHIAKKKTFPNLRGSLRSLRLKNKP